MGIDQNPNLEILENAVERLGSLCEQMVFLGGCATGLLLTDPAAPVIRVTRDVDVIVEVTSLAAYHRLNKELRGKDFIEDFHEIRFIPKVFKTNKPVQTALELLRLVY